MEAAPLPPDLTPPPMPASMHVPPPDGGGATLMDSIWQSIITPGASPTLIATINGVLLALLASLAYFCTTFVYSPHLVVMGALALLLLVAFNLFVSFSGLTTYRPAAAAAGAARAKEA
jgi:hypothetical protein